MTRRRAPLAGLLLAHAVSLTGNMLTFIALPLYALAETGSPAAAGLAGAFATAPVVLGGAFGGVLVDRFGYRRASITADVVSGTAIAAVPLLHLLMDLPFGLLLGLVFVAGVLDTPGQTARAALLSTVAEEAGASVERAVGLFEAVERGARLLGAPAAGLLVAVLGALPVLAVDAATFLCSALLMAVLVPRSKRRHTEARPEEQGYWRDLAAGVRFLVRDPLLRALVLLIMVTNMVDATKSTVLLPVYADRELGGAAAFGLLVGMMGGGALAGSLTFSLFGRRLPRRPTFVIGYLIAGGPPYLAMAAGVPLAGLIPVTLLAGFAAGHIIPITGTVKLTRVPAGMRARVFGVIGAGSYAVMPLGSLSAGYATDHFGLTRTLLVVGLTYLCVSLVPLLGGPWRELDRPRAHSHRNSL